MPFLMKFPQQSIRTVQSEICTSCVYTYTNISMELGEESERRARRRSGGRVWNSNLWEIHLRKKFISTPTKTELSKCLSEKGYSWNYKKDAKIGPRHSWLHRWVANIRLRPLRRDIHAYTDIYTHTYTCTYTYTTHTHIHTYTHDRSSDYKILGTHRKPKMDRMF